MKYPQLVSFKTVHEISDWLVKRLEDLEIEQADHYSRLLLSLLYPPLKINAIDLLEDLKQPYHLHTKNNEELKRLTAIESLVQISSIENKPKIENLVTELQYKLQQIESKKEENSMIGHCTSSSASSPSGAGNQKLYKSLKKIKRHHSSENPTKNYYLAFPALNGKSKATIVQDSNEAPGEKPSAWQSLTKSKQQTMEQQQVESAQKSIGSSQQPRASKHKRFDKKENRRLPKANGALNDVQLAIKSNNSNINTFSPKKMQKTKNGANSSVNINQKAKSQRYDSAKKTAHGSRNTNLSNYGQYAPKITSTDGAAAALGPWDMDFNGYWEMEYDLIGEFMQNQHNRGGNKKISHNNGNAVVKKKKQTIIDPNNNNKKNDDDDDVMMMNCLPSYLVDDDESEVVMKQQPPSAVNYQAQSVSSLQSKFDDKVKALWGNEPLAYKHQHFSEDDGISLASLASSFASEKNSLGLLNLTEQQRRFFIETEVNAPPFFNEMTSSYGGGKSLHSEHDYNNNFVSSGGMSKSSSFAASPLKHASSSSSGDQQSLRKFDFIKSGTNLQSSIWSDENFACEAESLLLKHEEGLDEVDSACRPLNSIGTEIKELHLSPEDEEVSLLNHSESSAFRKFKPQLLPSTIIRANYHPLNNASQRMTRVESQESIENYFTSEKTHWSPIMLDGDVFTNIDNRWDEIPYESTESGGLLYKNKEYQVWKTQSTSRIDLDAIEEDATREFKIKFALSPNNKGTQVYERDFIETAQLEINVEYCQRKIYNEYCKDEGVSNSRMWRFSGHEDSNDYSLSLFSVNRIRNTNNNSLNPIHHNIQPFSSSHSSSSSISTMTVDTIAVDPFESWRNIDNEYNKVAAALDKQHTHNVWEQCTLCDRINNTDRFIEKPQPANRLLKDELQMEGDEIMNVIQNLYITNDVENEVDPYDECDGENVHNVVENLALDDDSMDPPPIESEDANLSLNLDQDAPIEEFYDTTDMTNAKNSCIQDYLEIDQEQCYNFLKFVQSSLLPNENSVITQDSNNNDCVPVNTNTRKRRHSTCQNFMETKRCFHEEPSIHLASLSGFKTTSILNSFKKKSLDHNNGTFINSPKTLKINVEKIFFIAKPCLDIKGLKHYDDVEDEDISQDSIVCGANYYRNILHTQSLLTNFLPRPFTR